jgi:protocatechuate 3,4-dioxygenase beta subunit
MLRLLACALTLASLGAAGPQDPLYTALAPAETAPGARYTQQAGQLAQPPNSNNNTPPAPGTATLRGHVFAADSGQPLRKAQVRITAFEIRENRLATTDAEGRYEFKEVRAGRYTISASKGSYVGLSYGQQRPQEPPKPLQILDNQTVDRLDLSLPRGGVITGRILDEFGEPLSDVQMSVQQYQSTQGQRRLVPMGRQTATNDIGEFRLFGVPPGQYYVTATWRSNNPMSNEDRTAYAPMYFPGTENAAQAQRLTLAAGQEISDLVMALKPIRATRVTGTATTSDGRPFTGMVMAMSSGGGGVFTPPIPGQVRPDGTFMISGLAPGEYTLRAQTFGPSGPEGEVATATITATGDDIADLHLVGAKLSVVSGRIVVDPAIASAQPTALSLMLMPVEPGMMMGIGAVPGRMADDGTFELRSPPGKMRINLMNAGGWFLRAVRLNGTDLIDAGFEFKPGENVSGLEVEITNKTTVISGRVTNARSEPVKEYSAIAFSQDRERWKAAGRYQGIGRPDQDGRFKINGLPPGDYYVIALDKIEQGQSSDPDFLDAIKAKATAITIHDGETRTVDLKINAGS